MAHQKESDSYPRELDFNTGLTMVNATKKPRREPTGVNL